MRSCRSSAGPNKMFIAWESRKAVQLPDYKIDFHRKSVEKHGNLEGTLNSLIGKFCKKVKKIDFTMKVLHMISSCRATWFRHLKQLYNRSSSHSAIGENLLDADHFTAPAKSTKSSFSCKRLKNTSSGFGKMS